LLNHYPFAFKSSILSFFSFFLASSISFNLYSSSFYFLSSSSSLSLISFSILSCSAYDSAIILLFSRARAAAAFNGFFFAPLASFFSGSSAGVAFPSFCYAFKRASASFFCFSFNFFFCATESFLSPPS
jgi:hypothetical protein